MWTPGTRTSRFLLITQFSTDTQKIHAWLWVKTLPGGTFLVRKSKVPKNGPGRPLRHPSLAPESRLSDSTAIGNSLRHADLASHRA